MRVISVLDSIEIPIGYTGLVELGDGSKRWYLDGKLHRLDGPAMEWVNGAKWWYIEGIRVFESKYPTAVLLYRCRMVLES